MFDQDPDRNVGFLLHDVSRLLRKRFDRRARALGLTRAQWRVLVHLAPRQGINQSTLADILELDNVTLGRHVDRLEATGWLKRRSDPADRRAWCLHLTKKAQPVLDHMEGLAVRTQQEALNGISVSELDRLMATLMSIKRNILAKEETEGKASGAAVGAVAGGTSKRAHDGG
ncbi:MAG: MarR family transcriptional regulator [Kiloniellales bacterium]|nr:MarR family transcriptional regulator [Kiloniellales bacterium]